MSYLWRVSVEGGLDPERIELAGAGAIMPATLTAKDHLAFARRVYDMDVYRFESGQPARPVLTSTFAETEARLSPDGRRIAFCSARSGDQNEIWIADANGGSAQQLTRGPGSSQGSPSWSPDGRRLAFDSLGADFQWHIWIIDAEGGTPHQLTTHSGNQHVPSWSRDGQWIYFSAEQGKGQDIWRVPISGGSPVQITRGGSGKFASETAGGDSLLYQPKESDSALMIKPLRGGPTRQLVACVKHTAFGAGPQGVYYVPCDASSDPPVHVLDPATGRDRRLGTLQMYENSANAPPLGLSDFSRRTLNPLSAAYDQQRRPDVDRELQVSRHCSTLAAEMAASDVHPQISGDGIRKYVEARTGRNCAAPGGLVKQAQYTCATWSKMIVDGQPRRSDLQVDICVGSKLLARRAV